MPRCALLLFALAGLLGFIHNAEAAPAINNVSLRGLQIGGTTTLALQGSELAGEVKLLAPFAIAKQEVLPGASGQQVQLAITLDATVAPGIYAVRLATPTGITAPLVLGVDRLPQQPLVEQVAALPVAMSGALGGGQILKTTFAGKKDQPLVVDVEAQRIGANFKPTVRLYDSRGKQLAYSPPRHNIGGDARVAVTLPADDTYTIELHDLVYRAAGPGFFRLKVGELAYADFVLPQAIMRGSKSAVTFAATNVANGTTAEVDATADTCRAERPSAAPTATLFTGAQPGILVTEQNEAVEAPVPADGQKQTLSAVPSGVSGAIRARGEEDQYLVPVTAGQKLRIDVTARRLGSLLDGVLVIRGAAGNELARNDDQPGTSDPGLEFNVPAGVDKLLVCVRDMENRFGNEHLYHIGIREAAAPDFTASIATGTVQVTAGSTVVLPVNIARSNYGGRIDLAVQGLVGDVQVDGAVIPAGTDLGLLTLTARGGQPVHGVINIVAKAAEPGGPALARYVVGPEVNGATRYQPHLRREIGFAIAGDAPFTIAEDPSMPRAKAFAGARYPVPLVIARREGTQGDIRLKLVTTQPTLKKKIKEKNQDKEVDDLDRMLRLVEEAPVIKADQKQTVAQIQVPGDLPAQAYSAVVVAELLSPDGKKVVATTSTSALGIYAEAPFKLELTSTPAAEGRAGLGAAGSYTGKITRAPGFTQPVIITLRGLPGEVKMIPQVTLAADQTDFTLPLNFEYGSKAGEYKGVKLAASVEGSPNPSASSDVDLKVVAGEKPQ